LTDTGVPGLKLLNSSASFHSDHGYAFTPRFVFEPGDTAMWIFRFPASGRIS
jgi:hypothetical protein